jgi:hypothetical protein
MRDAILDRTALLQREWSASPHPGRSSPSSPGLTSEQRLTIGFACPFWSPHTRQSVERELAGQERRGVLAFWVQTPLGHLIHVSDLCLFVSNLGPTRKTAGHRIWSSSLLSDTNPLRVARCRQP